MTPVDRQLGSNYILTVVNRGGGGEETKWLKRKTYKETTWGIKGEEEEEESAWERSSSVCVP